MDLIPVKVECHSGYKTDEYPKRFYWNQNVFEIQEIIDRWYQSDNHPEYAVSNYFKVRTKEGHEYLLQHVIEKEIWFLCRAHPKA